MTNSDQGVDKNMIEGIIENTSGDVSDVLRALMGLTSIALRRISLGGFPLSPDEKLNILTVYNDGTALKTTTAANSLDYSEKLYLHRNGEALVYEILMSD